MYLGIIALPAWGLVLLALVLTHLTIVGVTLYLHRSSAHRAVDFHPALAHAFRAWLWLTTGMSTRQWTAVHRKHHAKCETLEDPHSPQVKGLARVVFGGVWLYRKEAANPETIRRYGVGTPDDWLERRVYEAYPWAGLALLAGLNILLFGVLAGGLLFLVQFLWIPVWAAGVVNGIGHAWGYRNFDSPDASRNLSPIAVLIGGEELHNNHHAFPTSPRLSVRKWEFDIGWLYLRVLSALGWATLRASPRIVESPRPLAAPAALDGVLASRQVLLAAYARLLAATWKEERPAPGLRARWWFQSASEGGQRLIAAAQDSARLRGLLERRTQLLQLWDDRHRSKDELAAHLQAWYAAALDSGEARLVEFAHRMMTLRIVRT